MDAMPRFRDQHSNQLDRAKMNSYIIGAIAGIFILVLAFAAPHLTGLSVGVDSLGVNFESDPLDMVPKTFGTVGMSEGSFIETDAFITSNGKPVIFFFGTLQCSHCRWEKKPFLEVAKEFGDLISVHFYELDVATPTLDDTEVLNNMEVSGRIPVISIAGKYYRVGSGENVGEEREKEILRYLIQDVLEQA
jgi:thiol-disulfide isomerase/thioredoxin